MNPTTESTHDTLPDLILYPRDTVMRALEVMIRHGVQVLPVVSERQAEVLGHVSEEELRRLLSMFPLVSMSELLTAREAVTSDDAAQEAQPVRVEFLPAEQDARSAWLH